MRRRSVSGPSTAPARASPCGPHQHQTGRRADFRTQFGLGANNVRCVNGPDPGSGFPGRVAEADLDVQWAGAVAKNASINLVVSASTNSSDGVALSAQYIVQPQRGPGGEPQFRLVRDGHGNSGNLFWNSLWQQAAAQGMTVAVSSGDAGAAGCDAPGEATAPRARGQRTLFHALQHLRGRHPVRGYGEPEHLLGGEQLHREEPRRWATSPKTSWNESAALTEGYELWASGGGQSSVYPKPSWQTGPGVPSSGLRAVPDVSLTAAGHEDTWW